MAAKASQQLLEVGAAMASPLELALGPALVLEPVLALGPVLAQGPVLALVSVLGSALALGPVLALEAWELPLEHPLAPLALVQALGRVKQVSAPVFRAREKLGFVRPRFAPQLLHFPPVLLRKSAGAWEIREREAESQSCLP